MPSSDPIENFDYAFQGPSLNISELDELCGQYFQQNPEFFYQPAASIIGQFLPDSEAQSSNLLWFSSAEQNAADNANSHDALNIETGLTPSFEAQQMGFSVLSENFTTRDSLAFPTNLYDNTTETLYNTPSDKQQINDHLILNDSVTYPNLFDDDTMALISTSEVARPNLIDGESENVLTTPSFFEADLSDPDFWAMPSKEINAVSNDSTSISAPSFNTNVNEPQLFDTSSSTFASHEQQALPLNAFYQTSSYNQLGFPDEQSLVNEQSAPILNGASMYRFPNWKQESPNELTVTGQTFNFEQQNAYSQTNQYSQQGIGLPWGLDNQQQPLFGRRVNNLQRSLYGKQGLNGHLNTNPYPLAQQRNTQNVATAINGYDAYGTPLSFQPAMSCDNYQSSQFAQTGTLAIQNQAQVPDQQIGVATSVPYSASPRNTTRFSREKNRNVPYNAEKPKKDPSVPHFRINNSTQGKSTRSGKINSYKSRDNYEQGLPHPFGGQIIIPKLHGQQADVFNFTELGAFNTHTLKAEVLETFILNHPINDNARLILWIQRTPADSSKRYPLEHLSKCRFAECPARRKSGNEGASINVGDFRVAIDQYYSTYGDRRDPCLCAGYIHLYCAERFFDWPLICRQVDVRTDTREGDFEPRGTWSAALESSNPNNGSDAIEGDAANDFIASCRNNTLENAFPGYVTRFGRLSDRWNTYMAAARSLNFRLMDIKIRRTAQAKTNMLLGRGAKLTHFVGNHGDLQIKHDALDVQKTQNPSDPNIVDKKRDLDRYELFGQEKLIEALPHAYQQEISEKGFEAFIRPLMEKEEAKKRGAKEKRDNQKKHKQQGKRTVSAGDDENDDGEHLDDDGDNEEEDEEETEENIFAQQRDPDGDYVPPSKRRRTGN